MDAGIPRLDGLRRALKSTVKEAVWLATRHEPGPEPDVALFATRRGGSTWLMEIIATAPGFRSLDQPFSIMTANLTPAHYRMMPKYAAGEIVDPGPEQLEQLRAYVETLLSGALPVNAPFRFWRPGFRWRTDRQVMKIVGAKPIIGWLADEFDLDVVYLTRHPIAQSLSCIRNGWTLTVHAYLDNPRFVASHLGAELAARCGEIVEHGTPLERFVLNWGLENLVPLRLLPSRPDWIHVTYEEMVIDPERVILDLAGRLRLGDPDALVARVRDPSRSSALSTADRRTAMATGDATTLLRAPLGVFDAGERERAMGILGELGIDLYGAHEIEARRGESA